MKNPSALAAIAAAVVLFPASAGAAGPQLWSQAGCGGCHTLQAAGSSGTAGPDLDLLQPSSGTVAGQVASGGGGMPSFAGSLSPAEIQSLASWVASVAGHGSTAPAGPVAGLGAAEVKRIQRELHRLGFFHGPVTGFYGPITTRAVKRFQRSAGLHADGIWGPLTAAALKRRLAG